VPARHLLRSTSLKRIIILAQTNGHEKQRLLKPKWGGASFTLFGVAGPSGNVGIDAVKVGINYLFQ